MQGEIPHSTHDDADVVSIEAIISAEHGDQLGRALHVRLHLVERAPGFPLLEGWQDVSQPGVFQMVSWWDDADSFRQFRRVRDLRVRDGG